MKKKPVYYSQCLMGHSRLHPSGMQPELHGCCTFYDLETDAVRVGPLPSVEPLSVL